MMVGPLLLHSPLSVAMLLSSSVLSRGALEFKHGFFWFYKTSISFTYSLVSRSHHPRARYLKIFTKSRILTKMATTSRFIPPELLFKQQDYPLDQPQVLHYSREGEVRILPPLAPDDNNVVPTSKDRLPPLGPMSTRWKVPAAKKPGRKQGDLDERGDDEADKKKLSNLMSQRNFRERDQELHEEQLEAVANERARAKHLDIVRHREHWERVEEMRQNPAAALAAVNAPSPPPGHFAGHYTQPQPFAANALPPAMQQPPLGFDQLEGTNMMGAGPIFDQGIGMPQAPAPAFGAMQPVWTPGNTFASNNLAADVAASHDNVLAPAGEALQVSSAYDPFDGNLFAMAAAGVPMPFGDDPYGGRWFNAPRAAPLSSSSGNNSVPDTPATSLNWSPNSYTWGHPAGVNTSPPKKNGFAPAVDASQMTFGVGFSAGMDLAPSYDPVVVTAGGWSQDVFDGNFSVGMGMMPSHNPVASTAGDASQMPFGIDKSAGMAMAPSHPNPPVTTVDPSQLSLTNDTSAGMALTSPENNTVPATAEPTPPDAPSQLPSFDAEGSGMDLDMNFNLDDFDFDLNFDFNQEPESQVAGS